MKHPVLSAATAAILLSLTACGDVGNNTLKKIARAILEEDNKSTAQIQEPQSTVPVQASLPEQHTAQPYDTQPAVAPVKTAPTPIHVKSAPIHNPVQPERSPNKPAVVVTRHGSNVMMRAAPRRNAGKVSYLYDGENVMVTGETNVCENIDGTAGCWVEVTDHAGSHGYVFNAYLQY